MLQLPKQVLLVLTSRGAENGKYLPAEKTKGAACLEQSQNQYLGNLSLYLDLVKQFCFFQSLGASVQDTSRDGSAARSLLMGRAAGGGDAAGPEEGLAPRTAPWASLSPQEETH